MFTFEIIGHTTDWLFFKQWRSTTTQEIAYITSRECHLKAFIHAVEALALDQPWDDDLLVEALLSYWLDNLEKVKAWQQTLANASSNTVLILRISSDRALRQELEGLFQI
jgi:hypothetical protein